MENLKNILIISYYWPPSGGAGVQRWLKFSKYLPEFGYRPHVYTPENPEAPVLDESLLNEIHPEIVVVKKPIFEPYSFYKKFTGKKGNVAHGFLSEDKGSRKKFTEKLSVWIRGNFFIPDARVFWIKPSVKFLEKYIQENHIQTIITTGPPHSMHLIGMALKERMNVRWIADFRDPWTNIDFYKDLMLTKWADAKHKRLEKKVLQKADKVICIGNTMMQELELISGRKVEIITNGYDSSDFPAVVEHEFTDFSIVHTGSINADRNHPMFWKVIEELLSENENFRNKLKIRFVGKNDYSVQENIQKSGLEKYCELISYVPHNEIVAYMMSAYLLYLPLNNVPNSKGVLTGKFFEYLASGRPILCIGHPEGDVAAILEKVENAYLVNFGDEITLKSGILEIFEKFLNGHKLISTTSGEYSRKNLTKKLVEIL